MTKLHVKKGDTVVVIAGKDKGKSGKVHEVIPSQSAVIVEKVNFIYKHKKPRSAQDKGGIIKKEGKIHSSNVQVVCAECKKQTRIAKKVIDGVKVRVCKHCGASLDKGVIVKRTKKAEPKVASATKSATLAKAPAKPKVKDDAKKMAPKSNMASNRSASNIKKTSAVRKTADKA